MKRIAYLCLFIVFFLYMPVSGQEEEKVLKETVTVVNVEVPVRVYDRKKPVDSLTKADFRLYENGKLQKINGFELKRKRIKALDVELNAERTEYREGRYFVLVFRITNYDFHLREGLEYIFNTVLNGSDQLLVFINNKSVFFDNLSDKESAKNRLDTLLHDESMQARSKMMLYVKSVELLVNKEKFEQEMKQVSRWWVVEEYLRKFLDVWKSYKRDYLIPDINIYYNFAKFLKGIKKEKWVLNFYQFELFPNILVSSENMDKIRREIGEWQVSTQPEMITAARVISRLMIEIEQELSLAKDFPSDEVAKLFHNVDATFHSVFMRSAIGSLNEDMEYRAVATELESSLRAITDLTGGELVVSSKIDTALDEISEAEDVYYVLTYAPDDPEKVGKIKVKLKNGKYKLAYSPNLRFGYLSEFIAAKETKTPPVQIQNLSFLKGKLTFTITDFLLDKARGGALSVRIIVNDPAGSPAFDQKKTIRADQNKINIFLNIKGIPKGEYDILVNVTDLFTKARGTGMVKATL